MKYIITALALITACSLGAESAPPTPAASAEPVLPAGVDETVHQALEQASHAAQAAVKDAAQALKHAQAKLALAEDEDGTEVSRMFLGDGPAVTLEHMVGSPTRTGGQPLIVRSGPAAPGTVSNLQEDLAIMSRILTKAVGHEGRDSAMGIVLSALPGSRHPQSLYLEGYGALFLLNVKYPLVPPSVKEDEKPEKPSDTTWDETRRELYGQRPGTIRIWNALGAEGPADYNADQVEDLKKELIEALKNATHLRDLKPDEFVTVAVAGGRESGGTTTRVKRSTRHSGANAGNTEAYVVNETNRAFGRESTLVIRVKKSDVDAFAKGDVDSDQFKKRASITAY